MGRRTGKKYYGRVRIDSGHHKRILLVMLVLYSDLILSLLGISLPMDIQVFSLIIYVLSAALQCAVHVWLRPNAELTYLAAYDQLREKPEDSGVVLGNIFDM